MRFFFFSSRRRHTRFDCDWSSDVCSSDLIHLETRYTLWSGLIGGLFVALAYFGTDQSQVQRYLGGSNLRESRVGDRKSTRLNSSHSQISYAVFCLKKKKTHIETVVL